MDSSLDLYNQTFTSVGEWLETFGWQILFVLAVMFVLELVLTYAVGRVIERTIRKRKNISRREKDQRIDTLKRVARGTITVTIISVGLLIILAEVGLEIGPLLATAGVAGVALGFGAQYIIRDLLTGLFILLENQYSVGDVVCLNGTCGAVEEITLRLTRLRDLDGVMHHIPNGEINLASNMSKRFSRVNIDVGVSYSSDLDQVIQVIDEVGQELAEDEEWADKIREPMTFLRVDKFGDSSIIMKILGETLPAEQWAVGGEFRKRLKKAFDESGIEIPFPQRVLHGNSSS